MAKILWRIKFGKTVLDNVNVRFDISRAKIEMGQLFVKAFLGLTMVP